MQEVVPESSMSDYASAIERQIFFGGFTMFFIEIGMIVVGWMILLMYWWLKSLVHEKG